MKMLLNLIQEEADKLPSSTSDSKYKKEVNVNSDLVLEFFDGKPYLAKYLNNILGPFTEEKLDPDDYPIYISEKEKWKIILQDNPNVKIIFNQGSDGAVYWTKVKAKKGDEEVILTNEYE